MTNSAFRSRSSRWIAVLIVATVIAGTSSLALAAAPSKVTTRGSCGGPTDWRLTLAKSGLKITVTFSADGGAKGQMWNVFGDQNNLFLFAVSRKSGTDGAFVVKYTALNLPGIDRINVGAQNRKTGEICSGSAAV